MIVCSNLLAWSLAGSACVVPSGRRSQCCRSCRSSGKTAGLAVVGERGEELTKDADEDEHADDDPDGGKGTGSKPPPGYFANQFTDDIFAANSRALHHDGPSRAFGDPWYS